MKIKQAFAIPETDNSYATLFAVNENGELFAVRLIRGFDAEKPDWFKVAPPTAETAEGANLQPLTPQGQNA